MIRSVNMPQCNHDDAQIIIRKYSTTPNAVTGEISTGWKYKTDKDTIRITRFWHEAALRPRPEASKQSFSRLIEFVKSVDTGETEPV